MTSSVSDYRRHLVAMDLITTPTTSTTVTVTVTSITRIIIHCSTRHHPPPSTCIVAVLLSTTRLKLLSTLNMYLSLSDCHLHRKCSFCV